MAIYSGFFPLKMVMFHCYVSLPEGIYYSSIIMTIKPEMSSSARAARQINFRLWQPTTA